MRGARLLLAVVAALAGSACARQQPTYYVVDPNSGQPVPVVTQQQYAQPAYAQPQYAQQGYAQPQVVQQPQYAQQSYAQPSYQQPVAQPRAASSGERGLFNSERGLFSSRQSAPQTYVPQPYGAQPQYAAPQGGPYVAAPYGYASSPAADQQPYTLDSGDKLRIVVFGQDGITNSYTVDAGGNVNLPLVGTVPARGYGTQQLAQMISERLKQGYVREHPRRGHQSGPVSLRRQHDGGDRDCNRRQLCPARQQEQGRAHPQRARSADPRRRAAWLHASPRRYRGGEGALVLAACRT